MGRNSLPNLPHPLKSTHGAKAVANTPAAKPTLKTRKSPHSPITDKAAVLMAACDARRIAEGLSYAEVGRRVAVHKSDVSRALRLQEEPSARTLLALVGYFRVGDPANLALNERRVALLTELQATLTRGARIAGDLAQLAALGPPEA